MYADWLFQGELTFSCWCLLTWNEVARPRGRLNLDEVHRSSFLPLFTAQVSVADQAAGEIAVSVMVHNVGAMMSAAPRSDAIILGMNSNKMSNSALPVAKGEAWKVLEEFEDLHERIG